MPRVNWDGADEALNSLAELAAKGSNSYARLKAELLDAQEREAGKDALIEALRDGIEKSYSLAANPPYHRQSVVDTLAETLALIPPAVLAQQREYVGALERVVDDLPEIARCVDCYGTEGERMVLAEMRATLAALDTTKKGAQP
jgi:predicted Ser/Thr protein kinase